MCKNRDVSRSICYLHDGITEKISTKSPKTSGDFEHRSHWLSRSWRSIERRSKGKMERRRFLGLWRFFDLDTVIKTKETCREITTKTKKAVLICQTRCIFSSILLIRKFQESRYVTTCKCNCIVHLESDKNMYYKYIKDLILIYDSKHILFQIPVQTSPFPKFNAFSPSK